MWAATFGKVPVLQNILQATRALCHHALVVDSHGCNVEAPWPHGLDGVHVGILLAQQRRALADGVVFSGPLVAQCLYGLGEAISRAACQDDFWAVLVRNEWVQILSGELAD